MTGDAAASWDAQYAAGRYLDEPPVAFVQDILAAAERHGLRSGVYVGCGNGRNLLPMLDAGLDLTGIDISAAAIGQLRDRRPDRAGKLIVGDVGARPASARYDLVIGIQVFQHGTRAQTHRHVLDAASRVAPGGLLCVRVNAIGTDHIRAHDIVETHTDGGFTVRYQDGPKKGLHVHFFAAEELRGLVAAGFAEVLPLRVQRTPHAAPAAGQWSQWEGIWRRTPYPS